MNEVAVLGGVAKDRRSGGRQLLEPLALHRSDELHERERLTTVGRVLVRQRWPRGWVYLAAREQHLAHVVAAGGAGDSEALVLVTRGLDQRELSVACHHARVGALQRELATGGIRHHEQVRGAVGARRFGARQGRACYQAAESGRR